MIAITIGIICTIAIDKYTQYLHGVQDMNIAIKHEHTISTADSVLKAVFKIEQLEISKGREIDSLRKQVVIEHENGMLDKDELSKTIIKLRIKEKELNELSDEGEDMFELLLSDLPATAAGSDNMDMPDLTDSVMYNYIEVDSIVYNYIELDSITYIYLIDTVQIVYIDSLIITNERDIRSIKRRYLKKNKRN